MDNQNYFFRRYWYQIELFIAKGGISVFYALALLLVANIVFLLVIRYFILWLVPESYALPSDGDFGNNIYHLFLEVTDPGNMASFIEKPIWVKMTAVLAGLSGIVIFSLLVALITTGTENLLKTIAEGTSQVFEEGHYIIIGKNSRLPDIIQEMILASEYERNKVVVFSENIDHDFDLLFKKKNKLSIILRKGKTTSPQMLERLALGKSKSVIVLSNCEGYSSIQKKEFSDTNVIKICYALSISIQKGNKLTVIPEIFLDSNRKVVKHILGENALLFDSDNILSRLLVQTSLFNGLVKVYEELFSFVGSELYFIKNPKNNVKFGDISYYLEDGIVIGYKCPHKGLLINPSPTDILNQDQILLLIMSDKSKFRFSNTKIVEPKRIEMPKCPPHVILKSKIIIGWNSKTYDIIAEYDKYLTEDSTIKLILTSACNANMEEVGSLQKQVKSKFVVEHVKEIDETYLENLNLFNYDMVVLLKTCSDTENNEIVDSRNIKNLLIIQKILRNRGNSLKRPVVVSEVLNTANLELFSHLELSDFLLSNRIVSIFLTQLTFQPSLIEVYDILLAKEGAEIYIRPATSYFQDFEQSYTMCDLLEAAQNKNEVAIGYKKFHLNEKTSRTDFQININPVKNKPFYLSKQDFLIVLADQY